jgi:hypothetical protein
MVPISRKLWFGQWRSARGTGHLPPNPRRQLIPTDQPAVQSRGRDVGNDSPSRRDELTVGEPNTDRPAVLEDDLPHSGLEVYARHPAASVARSSGLIQ